MLYQIGCEKTVLLKNAEVKMAPLARRKHGEKNRSCSGLSFDSRTLMRKVVGLMKNLVLARDNMRQPQGDSGAAPEF